MISGGVRVIWHQARVAAIGRAGHADAASRSNAVRNQRFGPTRDIVLLRTAPTLQLDRFLERQAEAGGAAIVRLQHGKACGHQILHLRIERVLGVRGRPAMHQDDRAARRLLRPVEPALDFHSVAGAPAKILRRRQLRPRDPTIREIGQGLQCAALLAHDADRMAGVIVVADPGAVGRGSDRQQSSAGRWKRRARATGRIEQADDFARAPGLRHHDAVRTLRPVRAGDLQRRIVDQPAHGAGRNVDQADAAMIARLRRHHDLLAVRRPLRIGFARIAGGQDLAIAGPVDARPATADAPPDDDPCGNRARAGRPATSAA